MPKPSRPELLDAACDRIAPLVRPGVRTLVGIAGPPAAGKSTLANALAATFQADLGPEAAVVVPMDGFHLSNAELERLGLAADGDRPVAEYSSGMRVRLALHNGLTELAYEDVRKLIPSFCCFCLGVQCAVHTMTAAHGDAMPATICTHVRAPGAGAATWPDGARL